MESAEIIAWIISFALIGLSMGRPQVVTNVARQDAAGTLPQRREPTITRESDLPSDAAPAIVS
jgi:hypothetical protein